MKLKNLALYTLPLLGGLLCTDSYAANPTVEQNRDQFIQNMVKKHQFKQADLNKMFQSFTFQDKIIKSMNRQAEDMTWEKYRPIFLTPKRTEQGLAFWQEHEATLNAASKHYGVPPEIIVAIIGVETSYGRLTGGYKVINALGTLAFGYPRRAEFFSKELEKFLLITRDQQLDPLTLEGSYAGAMGIPQFMPSSYTVWAVDFDGDGHKDLWHNPADAIGSVANYFKDHGWKTGQDIAYPVTVNASKAKNVLSRRIKLQYTLQQLENNGVKIPKQLNKKRKGLLIDLTLKSGKEYWIGLHNFYVITRYNNSTLYGMAVYQLSESLRAGREGKKQ